MSPRVRPRFRTLPEQREEVDSPRAGDVVTDPDAQSRRIPAPRLPLGPPRPPKCWTQRSRTSCAPCAAPEALRAERSVSFWNLDFPSGFPPFASAVRLISAKMCSFVIGAMP